jgi:hypothetical protein
MASKRQPSKQKRAAQNRNQRAARAARAANANAPAMSSGASASSSRSGAGGGSLLSRLRGGGATGAPSARARGAALRPDQPPGFRAALSGVFAAAAAVLLCTFALRYPVDASGDLYTREHLAADWSMTALHAAAEQPEASAAELADSIEEWTPGRDKETVVKALWPFSLAIVLPLIGAGIGFHAVRRRAPSKTVNRALYATLFGAVLTQGLLLLFLPVVLAIGVAMFQVRKAETMAAQAGAGDDAVIDVDEVEELDELDDSAIGEIEDGIEADEPGDEPDSSVGAGDAVLDVEAVDEGESPR